MSSTTQLDANQVIKKVYDDTTAAFLTVPSYLGLTTLFSAQSAAASFTSDAVNILPYKVTGLVVSWTGLDHVDGTIQFKGSVDGTFYDNIGSATTLSSTPGHQSYSLIDEPYQYFQIAYVHGTNTAGSLTAKYIQRA